ncbi:MAG: type 1 glutamine amidotransferase [Hyphomicrobium sp.]|nr:type 1 glutamine amidotransferase [Hyphomicrobium sp.]
MMRVLVFQHHDEEGPGSFETALREDGGTLDTVFFERRTALPDFRRYDQLWIMGGVMDVWDVDEHPWLVDEKVAIRRWIAERPDRPVFGLCLGNQLIADALGGTCGPMKTAEIGMVDVALNDAARSDPLLSGLPSSFKTVQAHGVRVAQLPDGAVSLASSAGCRHQAARYGDKVWGWQAHVEAQPDTITRWAELPDFCEWQAAHQGEGALDAFIAEARSAMPEVLAVSAAMYRNLRGLGV